MTPARQADDVLLREQRSGRDPHQSTRTPFQRTQRNQQDCWCDDQDILRAAGHQQPMSETSRGHKSRRKPSRRPDSARLRQRLIDDMNMRRFSPRDPAATTSVTWGASPRLSGARPDTATGGGSAPLPDRAARGRRSRADDERIVSALRCRFSHLIRRSRARPRAPAGPGGRIRASRPQC